MSLVKALISFCLPAIFRSAGFSPLDSKVTKVFSSGVCLWDSDPKPLSKQRCEVLFPACPILQYGEMTFASGVCFSGSRDEELNMHLLKMGTSEEIAAKLSLLESDMDPEFIELFAPQIAEDMFYPPLLVGKVFVVVSGYFLDLKKEWEEPPRYTEGPLEQFFHEGVVKNWGPGIMKHTDRWITQMLPLFSQDPEMQQHLEGIWEKMCRSNLQGCPV